MRLAKRAARAAIIPALVLIPYFTVSSAAAQEATPATTYSYETAMTLRPEGKS